MVAMGFTYF